MPVVVISTTQVDVTGQQATTPVVRETIIVSTTIINQ